MLRKKIELILLRELLYDLFTITIEKDEVLGLYNYGSVLYGVDTEVSDLDYAIVLSDDCGIWNNPGPDMKEYIQMETDELDLHIMSEKHYKELLQECDIMALEMFYQEAPILKYSTEFTLNKFNLRRAISTMANNSWVKAKKKITIPEEDNYIGIKSLFHSLRIIQLGTQIGSGGSVDVTKFGYSLKDIQDSFDIGSNWDYMNLQYKVIYNRYMTEFKKVAPKEIK